MICPKCGADNEAGARFCVECGAPLDTSVDLPSPEIPDQDDRTILSSLSRLAEEAKTVSVTQDQLAEAEAAAASTPFRPEPPPPPPPMSASAGSSEGQGWMTRRNMIIMGVVIVALLLCCCCSVIIGGIMADPEIMKELDLSVVPYILSFI